MRETWKEIPWLNGIYQINRKWIVRKLLRKDLKNYRTLKQWEILRVNQNKVEHTYYIDDLLQYFFKWWSPALSKPRYSYTKTSITRSSLQVKTSIRKFTKPSRTYNPVKKFRTTKKFVNQYTKWMEFVKKWESAFEVSIVMWLDQWNINRCCNGKLNSAYWYIWTYDLI